MASKIITLSFTFIVVAAAFLYWQPGKVAAGCKTSHKVGCDEDACKKGLDEKECVYSCDSCDPADTSCQTGQYKGMEDCPNHDGGGTSSSGGGTSSSGGGTSSSGSGPTAVPTPTCAPYALKSGSVEPNYVFPGAEVLVRCGYGFDSDCVTVTGGGLTNCTVRTYVNGETIFGCRAGANAGVYTNVKCVTNKSATNRCCVPQQDPLPPYTVLSTSAHFEQRMRVPGGIYTLSVRYNTVISKGVGAFVDLLCASDDCGGGKRMNSSMAVIPMNQNGAFETKSMVVAVPPSVPIKDFKVRVVVGEGSETYIDKVSFSGGGTEYVLNGDFRYARSDVTSVALDEPAAWGEASNKIGYYYGMAVNTKLPGVPMPPIVVPSGGVVPPNPGVTAPGSTSMKLNLKIKLQGVASKPKAGSTIVAKVKVGGRLLAQPTAYQNVTFTAGDGGIWSGSTTLSLPPGPGYAVYIKGPKHLQKKVCDIAPTEGSGGRYHCADGNITLQAGDNTADMSKILMLVGDLPENGVQNGVVDSYDTSFVRQHLQSTKAEDLAIGDLNYDGVIDGQDFSLVIASLSVKYDEE